MEILEIKNILKKALEQHQKMKSEGEIYYKIVRKNDDHFASIYDPENWKYKIGETYRETAKSNHNGGLYVWPSLELAKENLGNSEIYCDGDAILECRAKGRKIEYSNKKIAVSEIVPTKIVFETN